MALATVVAADGRHASDWLRIQRRRCVTRHHIGHNTHLSGYGDTADCCTARDDSGEYWSVGAINTSIGTNIINT